MGTLYADLSPFAGEWWRSGAHLDAADDSDSDPSHRPRRVRAGPISETSDRGARVRTTVSQIDWAPANEPDNIRSLEGIAPLEQALTGGTPQRVGGYRFYFNDERWEWSPEVGARMSIPWSRPCSRVRAGVPSAGLNDGIDESSRFCLPLCVDRSPTKDCGGSAAEQRWDAVGRAHTLGLGCNTVGGNWPAAVIGDDRSSEATGVPAGSALSALHAVDVLAVILTFDWTLIQVGGVGVAPSGHRDVRQGAAGVFAQHGVGRIGGDALCGVHGDGVAVGDVLTDIVVG